MKTPIFLLAFLLIVNIATATKRRVNNNTGVTGLNVYATLKLAHDAAVANDTLIVEPSATNYGDLTLTKPLVIFGTGYYLDINAGLKADTRTSQVGYINFNTGSGGSSMYGIELSGYMYIYGVSNITIQRCRFINYSITIYNQNAGNTTNANVQNIYVSQCAMGGGVGGSVTSGYTITNVLIINNIMSSVGANSTGISSWVVKNNTFTSNGYYFSLSNSIVDSNLFTYSGGSNPTLSNTSYSYNVCVGTSSYFPNGSNTFPTSASNNYNVNLYDIVTQTDLQPSGTGISYDEQFQIINVSSPLLTAASDGGQVGAFGGSTPYLISGVPAVPSIVSDVSTATGSDSKPLTVTISIKANN